MAKRQRVARILVEVVSSMLSGPRLQEETKVMLHRYVEPYWAARAKRR